MTRSALSVQAPALTGTVVSLTAANVDGHSITVPRAGCFLVVANASESPITVTTDAPGTQYGTTYTDPSGAVAAGVTRYFKIPGTFPYLQTTGVVHVDFSAVTTVTVAAVKI